jgi:hypothetical protein
LSFDFLFNGGASSAAVFVCPEMDQTYVGF